MKFRTRLPRYGFTLVEMLIVIAIIGALIAITVPQIWKAVKNARQAKVQVEIDQLSEALQGYKEKHLQYGPCMGIANATQRQSAFVRHVMLAFPNANISTYGTFANIQTPITKTWQYNYKDANGSVQSLDLNKLDQAESLVFWLGGFPTPIDPSTNQPIVGRKLYGFHKSTTDPFRRDVTTATTALPSLDFRTINESFNFAEERLVDQDRDGWWEYIPTAPDSGGFTPPYVYFDNTAYGATLVNSQQHLGYPRLGFTATDDALAAMWGVAVPYALAVPSSSANAPIRWANSTKFQIICAGISDMKYAGPDPTTGADVITAFRIPTFPNPDSKNGEVYTLNGSNFGYLSKYELDNQTNMSSKTMEGVRDEAQK